MGMAQRRIKSTENHLVLQVIVENRDNAAAGNCGGHAGLLEMCAILSSAIQKRDANGNWGGEAGLLEAQEILEPCRPGHGHGTAAYQKHGKSSCFAGNCGESG